MKKVFNKMRANIPLLLVVLVGVFIALQNTSIRGFYSGWDNIHAEINLGQYAYRVFFGAWQAHQGLGGPAAKGHLAEITRLPLLFILQQVFPVYLVRAVFLFIMYLVGGTNMYFFVKNWWLAKQTSDLKSWIAGFASFLYLLHPLTLQQFYISFELFTVQFAFFPLLLIFLHKLSKKITKKSVLLFLLVQLALASSAHTPTVFYLGVLTSLLYAFGLHLQQSKKILKALKFTFLIGLLSFLMNSFWIIPNLYYTFNNSQYVTESKANIVFGPEALWSIREASTLHNFLTGYHYLTTWKDYNFANKEHELIFNEWAHTFTNPFINFRLYVLAGLTLIGSVLALYKSKKEPVKLATVLIFIFCSTFIWIDLFPTKNILLPLFENKTFLEIFRNPFTKLSILHSIFVVILAVETLSSLLFLIERKLDKSLAHILIKIILILGYIYVLTITPPSFSGKFISEKLKVFFPPEYQEFYAFLQTKDHADRVLEMPYTSREGWVLYDWSTENRTNAYQGIGFYFFGFPQPFLTPDFARWSGVNDYFYEELSFALNSKNPKQLNLIAKKYLVPLVVLDESRIVPYTAHSFAADKELLTAAGYVEIWNKDFLTVYENSEIAEKSQPFIIPNTITKIYADTARVSEDPIFSQYGEYINSEKNTQEIINQSILFPFSSVLKSELQNHEVTTIGSSTNAVIPEKSYTVKIPALATKTYNTTIAVKKENDSLQIFFPQYSLVTDANTFKLPTLPNATIPLATSNQSAITIQGKLIALNQGSYSYMELNIPVGESVFITDSIGTNIAEILPYWQELTHESDFDVSGGTVLKLETQFPTITADLTKQPSENCVTPKRGEIITTYSETGSATYTADNFGVNCNSISLPFMSPAHSYIATAVGENNIGRSIKLFIHYSQENITYSEFILPENTYHISYPLKELSSNTADKLFLNWETRSFGKLSSNTLDSLKFMPIPLEAISNIQLIPTDNDATVTTSQPNVIQLLNAKKHSTTYYSFTAICESEKNCFAGINQAHDDAWIAFDITNKKILKNFRYNNWANIWEISAQKSRVIIVYIPQIIAFICMFSATAILFFSSLYRFRKNDKKRIKNKIKKIITGDFIRSFKN